MLALYELLNLLPQEFVPMFAPRHNKLCVFLLENEPMDKEEATIKYLGNADRQKYFNNLKNELKKALVKYLIAYPSVPENSHRTIYEECYQHHAFYKTFLARGKREIAIEIAEELLPKVRDAELFSLAHSISQDLYFHYSTIDYTRHLAKKYKKLTEVYFGILKAESLVRMYHSRVGFITNSRDSYPPEIIAEFEEAAEHTRPFLQLGYEHLNRLIYSIIISRYLVAYDYKNILKSCDEALASFSETHPNKRALHFAFIHKKIPPLIALGQLTEAKELAKKAGQMVPAGSFNSAYSEVISIVDRFLEHARIYIFGNGGKEKNVHCLCRLDVAQPRPSDRSGRSHPECGGYQSHTSTGRHLTNGWWSLNKKQKR